VTDLDDVVVFVLAAGTGSRLAPLTNRLPKPLVPLGGVAILERNVQALARAGFRELIVNVHHLAEKVMDHFGDGAPWGVRISWSFEPVLLGTAGALKPVRHRLAASTFVVLYGDNLFECDLLDPLRAHRASNAALTVTWVERPDPGASGVLRMDADGTLTDLLEKPGPTVRGPAPISAGLLVAEPRVLDFIPDTDPSDLARDVIPALLRHGEQVRATPLNGRILWVDTPADLQAAEAVVLAAAPRQGGTRSMPRR
jgi:mannose-1-phosphate guanylyltransferase